LGVGRGIGTTGRAIPIVDGSRRAHAVPGSSAAFIVMFIQTGPGPDTPAGTCPGNYGVHCSGPYWAESCRCRRAHDHPRIQPTRFCSNHGLGSFALLFRPKCDRHGEIGNGPGAAQTHLRPDRGQGSRSGRGESPTQHTALRTTCSILSDRPPQRPRAPGRRSRRGQDLTRQCVSRSRFSPCPGNCSAPGSPADAHTPFPVVQKNHPLPIISHPLAWWLPTVRKPSEGWGVEWTKSHPTPQPSQELFMRHSNSRIWQICRPHMAQAQRAPCIRLGCASPGWPAEPAGASLAGRVPRASAPSGDPVGLRDSPNLPGLSGSRLGTSHISTSSRTFASLSAGPPTQRTSRAPYRLFRGRVEKVAISHRRRHNLQCFRSEPHPSQGIHALVVVSECCILRKGVKYGK
jgi:hypothetical protein